MPHTRQILPLADLQPGMILAEPVRDRFGNVMLTAGTVLAEKHLAALRQRGIASARIVPEHLPPSAAERAALQHATEQRLQHLFRKTLDLPANRRLFDILLAYRQEDQA